MEIDQRLQPAHSLPSNHCRLMPQRRFPLLKKFFPQAVKLRARDALWPWLRWQDKPEIEIKTYHPDCVVTITNPSGTWHIDLTNGDPDKITSEEIRGYFGKLLSERLPADCRLTRG